MSVHVALITGFAAGSFWESQQWVPMRSGGGAAHAIRWCLASCWLTTRRSYVRMSRQRAQISAYQRWRHLACRVCKRTPPKPCWGSATLSSHSKCCFPPFVCFSFRFFSFNFVFSDFFPEVEIVSMQIFRYVLYGRFVLLKKKTVCVEADQSILENIPS